MSTASLVLPANQVVDNADTEETAGVVIRPGGFTGLSRERSDLLFQRVIALEDISYEPLLFVPGRGSDAASEAHVFG